MNYSKHFYMLNSSNEYEEVTSIEIPNTVTYIGDYQFYGFNNVTNITISSNVTTIGNYAFSGCTSLEKITLPFVGGSKDNNTYLGYIFGAPSYSDNSNYVPSSLKEVDILEGCMKIGDNALRSCTSLTSITLPSSVETIGNSAFSGCTSLTSITIPEGVTAIGDYAFYGCTSLTIYCEVKSRPSGWSVYWNSSQCTVVWNYKNN